MKPEQKRFTKDGIPYAEKIESDLEFCFDYNEDMISRYPPSKRDVEFKFRKKPKNY